MGIISQEKARNYLPLDVKTRLSCCQRRANSGWSVKKICSYYHVSRQSLWRWMARFDGSGNSLADLSHRPHSECVWKTPEKTAHKIECLANRRKRGSLSSIDIWMKLNSLNGYGASYSTVLRILKRTDGYEPYSTNPKKKHNGRYHTPEGFFGTMKNEFYCPNDWASVSTDEFIPQLEKYLVWFRDKRIKARLGNTNAKEYLLEYEKTVQ